jgi:predicted SAM-dependent methyltransferase
MNELYRVLIPGGTLEVAVPNLVKCAQALLSGSLEILNNIYSPNAEPAQQHRWGYTPKTLMALLGEHRFEFIQVVPPDPSDPNEVRMMAVKCG